MGFAFGEEVVVHRRSGTTQDVDGNDVDTFTPEPYDGVGIGPGVSIELAQGQSLVTDELHAYFKPAILLNERDRVEVLTGPNAGSYDVDGRPKHYRSPLTGNSGTDAKLLQVKG